MACDEISDGGIGSRIDAQDDANDHAKGDISISYGVGMACSSGVLSICNSIRIGAWKGVDHLVLASDVHLDSALRLCYALLMLTFTRALSCLSLRLDTTLRAALGGRRDICSSFAHRSLEREGQNGQIDGYRYRHTRPIAIWQHANDTCLPSIKLSQTFPNVLALRRRI